MWCFFSTYRDPFSFGFLGFEQSTYGSDHLPSLKLRVRTWKWMVSFLLGPGLFSCVCCYPQGGCFFILYPSVLCLVSDEQISSQDDHLVEVEYQSAFQYESPWIRYYFTCWLMVISWELVSKWGGRLWNCNLDVSWIESCLRNGIQSRLTIYHQSYTVYMSIFPRILGEDFHFDECKCSDGWLWLWVAENKDSTHTDTTLVRSQKEKRWSLPMFHHPKKV